MNDELLDVFWAFLMLFGIVGTIFYVLASFVMPMPIRRLAQAVPVLDST